MKPPNPTSLRRHAGNMKTGNLEKALKEIRQGLAWMRTEQKEMKNSPRPLHQGRDWWELGWWKKKTKKLRKALHCSGGGEA
jgi:hypothetical protein